MKKGFMVVSCDIEIYCQFYQFVAPDDSRQLLQNRLSAACNTQD